MGVVLCVSLCLWDDELCEIEWCECMYWFFVVSCKYYCVFVDCEGFV